MSSFAIPVSPETLGFSVTPVPCFQDNYSYIIRGNDGTIALVDPCEPPKVLAALDTHNIRRADVAAILTTHKHWDHAGGNEKIVAAVNKAKGEAASSGSSAAVMNSSKVVVVGGVEDAVSCCTLPVSHDDVFIVGGLTIRAIHTPCHTRGHICFHVRASAAAAAATGASTVDSDATAGSAEAGAVFTGDTLFVGGTGRLFEGNAAEMYANLTSESKLGGLPGGALVYAGHEYTKSNLLFAVDAAKDAADSASSGEGEGAAVAAASSLIASKLAWVIAGGVDGAGLTMPSSMKQERETNVFILAHNVKEFAKLRTWKDDWRAST